MEVDNIGIVERRGTGPLSRCSGNRRGARSSSFVDWRRRLLKRLWIPGVALAGIGVASFEAFGQSVADDVEASAVTVPVAGASSGVFINSTGAPGMVSSGIGTNSFSWGLGVNSPPSSLTFAGTSVSSVVADQSFSLGTLSYVNGVILAGTEARSVDLRTTVNFSGTSQTFDYTFDLANQLVNTPNTANSLKSADFVFLSNSIPTSAFSIDGVDYTLQLALGSVTEGEFKAVDHFFVMEGGTASAELVGRVTVVPEPSTILGGLAAAALMGAFLLRNFRRNNASATLA